LEEMVSFGKHAAFRKHVDEAASEARASGKQSMAEDVSMEEGAAAEIPLVSRSLEQLEEARFLLSESIPHSGTSA
jgi:hypothetical protein